MGDWATYKITLANKDLNIKDVLIQKGLLSSVEDTRYNDIVQISVTKEQLQEMGYYHESRDADFPGHFKIRGPENSLAYFSKWQPNDRIAFVISKLLPEEIVDVELTFDAYYFPNVHWYAKNGEEVTVDGRKVLKSLYEIKPTLLKEVGDKYEVSLPIGEEPYKWGKITVPKENIAYLEYQSRKYSYSVSFDTETVDVMFGNKRVSMRTEDVVNKYYESKENFRQQMSREVVLENLPLSNFKQMRNPRTNSSYYIVKIPCEQNVSINGEISITVPLGAVNVEEGTVSIGAYGKERDARVMQQDGTFVFKRILHSEIEKSYQKAMESGRVNVVAESELEADMDLD